MEEKIRIQLKIPSSGKTYNIGFPASWNADKLKTEIAKHLKLREGGRAWNLSLCAKGGEIKSLDDDDIPGDLLSNCEALKDSYLLLRVYALGG